MTGAVRGAIVAGIGFRHAAACEEIVALVRRALVEGGAAPADLAAIATARDRAAESAIREAAAALASRWSPSKPTP